MALQLYNDRSEQQQLLEDLAYPKFYSSQLVVSLCRKLGFQTRMI